MELDKLHQALKAIKAELKRRLESCGSEATSFIQFVLESTRDLAGLSPSQKVVTKEIALLADKHSAQPLDLESNLLYLKIMFVKRCESLLYDECQRRKENALAEIRSSSSAESSFQTEIEKKRTELDALKSGKCGHFDAAFVDSSLIDWNQFHLQILPR